MRAFAVIGVIVGLGAASPARAWTVDPQAREIAVKIVYVAPGDGQAARDNLEYVYRKTDPQARSAMTTVPAGDGASALTFDFAPLDLGELHGFHFRFHLYALVTPGKLGTLLADADGVVFVADAGSGEVWTNGIRWAQLATTLRHRARDARGVHLAVQVVHSDANDARPLDEIREMLDVGSRPFFAATPASGPGVFDTLKAVAKASLLEMKQAGETAH